MISEFSVRATVGHASTHAPHETHSDARKGSFWLADTFDANPRPWIVSANVPWVSSHARTHREQAMHIVWSKVKYGLLVSFGRPWWLAPLRPYRVSVTSSSSAMSCSSQWPLAGQLTQSRGWSERYSSMTPRRSVVNLALSVRTLIPSLTNVVQEAGYPRRPSISTRHRRHEPKAFSESVAHNFGICRPTIAAARMIDVPSGTVTARPSISSVTGCDPSTRGVPKSAWSREYMAQAFRKSSRKYFSALCTG